MPELSFNSSRSTPNLWNADAHGKNYSVLLDGNRVELAPLYDAVPTRLYPTYSSQLAMAIGRTDSPALMGAASWRSFARHAALNEEQVIHTAFTIRDGIAERYRDYIQPLTRNPGSERNLRRHLQSLQRQIRAEPLN